MAEQGINSQPFNEESLYNPNIVRRPLLRSNVAEAETNEEILLLELRQQYPNITDDVFWKIYEFIKRKMSSKNGGRKKSYRRKSHRKSYRKKHRKTMRH